MNDYSFTQYKKGVPTSNRPKRPSLFGVSFKNQARVSAPESKAVREHAIDFRLAGLVRNVIEIAFRIGDLVVYRRRQFLFADRKHRDNRFDPASGPEGMPGHRFSRADGKAVTRMFAEYLLDRQRFELVVVGRRRAVLVHVTDLFRRAASILDRALHNPDRTRTGFVRHRYMEGVAAHPVPDDLCKDVRPPRFCEFEFLKDQDSGALADHEPIAFRVERPRSMLRVVIPRRE